MNNQEGGIRLFLTMSHYNKMQAVCNANIEQKASGNTQAHILAICNIVETDCL